MMRDVYCLGEDIQFAFTVDTVDTVFILTPHGDTLWAPYILPNADVADSGWYFLWAHSALACVQDWGTDSIFISVLNLFKPDLGVDRYLCTGEMIDLHANYQSENDVLYHWNTGDTTESILILASGDYILTVEVFNPATQTYCRSKDTIAIIYYPQAIANFESTTPSGCAPLTIGFTGHCTPEDVLETRWSIFDENFNELYYSHEKDPVFEITQAGTFSVKLIITTYEGCQDSVIMWNYITTSPQPIVDFISTPEISIWSETNGEVQFTSYIYGNEDPNSSLVWYFGDGEEVESELNPTHTYASWGDYIVTLSVSTDAGCIDTVSHYVIIEENLIFPNIITPNGDGINDVWAIGNLSTNINPEDPDKYRTNELHIYNRWGKQVYHAKNYDTYSRNGEIFLGEQYFTGEDLSDGVYYYSFYYKGKAKVVKYNGSISILR
jgi:gliding motility-associated-like protein